MRWKEIPAELGAELWKSYRNDLLRSDRVVGVHAVSHGHDFVETVISVTQGDAVLLRLVTSFDLDWETAPDGISWVSPTNCPTLRDGRQNENRESSRPIRRGRQAPVPSL